MRFCGGTVSLTLSLLLTAEAHALSITNRDDKAHKITIVEASGETTKTLAPLAVLDGVCMSGCIIRLNDSADDEYELEGPEVVSVEDGFLYYDGEAPAPGTAPASGAADKPAETPAAPKKP